LLLGAAFVDACAAMGNDEAPGASGCFGLSCDSGTPPDAAPDHTLEVGTLDQQHPSDASPYNPLCGEGCDPDDAQVCGDAVVASVESAGDSAADAGSEGAADAATAPEAGPSDSGTRRDVETRYACQVHRVGSGRTATCGPAGSGTANAPCVSAADCAPGWACVGDAKAALCRRYCCSGSEGSDGSNREAGASSCDEGNYCAARPLRDDADSADPLEVPVCVPAEKCLLSEPYPCPPNSMCTCPAGTACTVVRNDGTTGCLEPGDGVQGAPCSPAAPCAAGYFCSRGTDRCVKLCLTTAAPSASPCGAGKCQSSPGLPED